MQRRFTLQALSAAVALATLGTSAFAQSKDTIKIVFSSDVLDGGLWGDNGTYGGNPSSNAGTSIDVNAVIAWRICVRSVRLPTTGPDAATSGGDGKNSRTMSDTWATWRHQSPATSPPKGGEEDRRFKSLLRRLVAVPVSEIHEKRRQHRKKRRGARRKSP